MSDAPDQSATELRALLRYAFGLGLEEAEVREIYEAVCQWAQANGMDDPVERLAEIRRQLIRTATEG